MTRKKFVKAVSLVVAWAVFLSLVITNWNDVTSVRWQDLRESIKLSGIVDIIQWHAGYFLLLSLSILFIALYVRHIRKRQFISNHYDDEEEKRRRDRLRSPAYSSLGGNIHYGSDNYTTDKAFDE